MNWDPCLDVVAFSKHSVLIPRHFVDSFISCLDIAEILDVICRGLNPIYDCFPCQIFTFGRNLTDGSLQVVMDYQADM